MVFRACHPASVPVTLRAMKTRLLPLAVLFVSFLLPVRHLRAASDVAVSTAATSGGSFSGGNPNVFTPTVNAAVANQTTIQTSLNAGTGVTVNTASAATGNGDFQIAATVSKTAGAVPRSRSPPCAFSPSAPAGARCR